MLLTHLLHERSPRCGNGFTRIPCLAQRLQPSGVRSEVKPEGRFVSLHRRHVVDGEVLVTVTRGHRLALRRAFRDSKADEPVGLGGPFKGEAFRVWYRLVAYISNSFLVTRSDESRKSFK